MSDDVRFAVNGDVHLAYRILGEGDVDAMFVPMWFSNLDVLFEHPTIRHGLESVSEYCRLIVWDRRGAGLSDRMIGPATLEQGMDDLIAVLDDAGVERTALIGLNESNTLCMLMAASRPDRVSSLILYGSFATTRWFEDYPWGQPDEERAEQIQWIAQNWGAEDSARVMFPSGDDATIAWARRWQRNSVTRDALMEFYEMLGKTDVRHVLPTIRVPTLVLHRKNDFNVPVENARYIASKIPGARLVELEGWDHVPFIGEWEPINEEIEEFLTGQRRTRPDTRVLATILFTDIVDSTDRLAELGDGEWRRLLDAHDEVATAQTERFGGRIVKHTGDGVLATFDGPARAIRCGQALRASLMTLGIEVRAGLHTGEVEVRGDDVNGIAVHIGARVAGLAGAGELFVSEAVPPLVAGSGIEFEERGAHELKGVPGQWRVFAVR